MIVKQPNRVLKNRGGITMREYIASAYDGHDYIFFFFCSNHRAGSKANNQDALTAYKKAHGRNRSIKIVNITRQQSNGEPVLMP